MAGTFSGVYTLITWSVFVLACRHALVRRTLRPFVAPVILTAGLVLLRPWTVDDFTGQWAAGVRNGNSVAQVSLALTFVLAALLAAADWRLSDAPVAIEQDRVSPVWNFRPGFPPKRRTCRHVRVRS